MAKTILLADDSVTIQKVVELTFMDEDYRVVATGDGASALEQLPDLEPDLVIADVHMPGADGYEVCRQTKASHPSIPVLLLVGTFEQFDEQKAAAVGADGHLKKPFDSQELLSRVEALIAGPGLAAPAAAQAPAEADSEIEAAPLDLEPPALQELESSAGDVWSVLPPEIDDAPAFDLEPPAFGVMPPVAELDQDVTETAAVDLREIGLEADAAEPAEFDLEASIDELPEDLKAPSLEAPPIEDFAPFEDDEPVAEEPSQAPSAEPATAAVGVADELAEQPAVAAHRAADDEPPVAESAAAPPAAVVPDGPGTLSDDDVERIARRVAELVGEKALRDVAWEVLPDLAEVIIKERIRELESQVV